MTLDQDIAVATVEDDVEPHGRLEDAAAHNTWLEPIAIAGVDRAAIIDALDDELAQDNEGPDEDSIIAVADIPPLAPEEALVVDNEDSSNKDEDTNIEDSDNEDNDTNDEDSNDEDDNDRDAAREADNAAAIAAGLRRSGRGNKGRTERYANYTLLLHARKAAQGGPKRAILHDGVMMFSTDDVSDAKREAHPC